MSGKNDFISHIEEGMRRFGMKLESSSQMPGVDLQKLIFTDSIHNISYIALARRGEARKPEKFWGDIIDGQLKELIKSTATEGNPLPAALIMPSDEAESAITAAASKGVRPTVYQLFDGFVVVGFRQGDTAKLIKEEEQADPRVHDQVEVQNFTAKETTDAESLANIAATIKPQPVEKTHEPQPAEEPKPRAEITKRTPDPEPPKAKMDKRKLIAAALLGVSLASVPFAINKIPGGDAKLTPDNKEAIVEVLSNAVDGQSENKELQASLAENAPLPQYDLSQLMERGYIKEVAENPNLDPEKTAQLANSPDPSIRAAAATNPSLPEKSMDKLSNDQSPLVRSALASNPSIPENTLYKLSNDPEFAVRSGALANPQFDPELLHLVEPRIEDASCENREKIYAGKCVTPEMIEYNADNPDPCIKRGIAKNPSTPPEIIAKLSKDNDTRTRHNALKNPNISPSAMNELFSPGWENTDSMDINAALSNPSVPEKTVATAMQNPGKYGVVLSSNPKIPSETAKKLYNQSSPKGGMAKFFNDVNQMPGDKELIKRLAETAGSQNGENDNGWENELRKEINKSFAKNVYDPVELLNDDAKQNNNDGGLSLPQLESGEEFFDTSGGSFTLPEMPETYEEFFNNYNELNGRTSSQGEQRMISTADGIVDGVFGEIKEPVSNAVNKMQTDLSISGSSSGGVAANDPLLLQAYKDAMPYGYGRSYSSAAPGNILSDGLFENSCKDVDSLSGMF